jgi:hypothetical protein
MVPFPLHPCQYLLLFVFLLVAILTEVRWNLSVVLICISFMARGGEHFFYVFFSHLDSSFEKVLFSSVAYYFIGSLLLFSFIFMYMHLASDYM